MRSHHILTLQENSLGGNDYIIGDIHGDDSSFAENLRQLQPNDRLFVAGDLTDRGIDSPNVMRLILDYQQAHPDRLYIACGNHEIACLKTIKLLHDMAETIDEIPFSLQDSSCFDNWLDKIKTTNHHNAELLRFKSHLKDGGSWLVKLFKQELFNGDITIFKGEQEVDEFDSSEEQESEIIYQETSLIGKIHIFIERLPYIIFVGGENPFTIVHADMPYPHDRLQAKISQAQDMTPDKIKYAINARVNKGDALNQARTKTLIQTAHRHPRSIISYCGHNIVAFGQASVVRQATNTVNLDTASFRTQVSLRVNHTQASCEYIGVGVSAALLKYPQLVTIQAELTEHLKKIASFGPSIEQGENKRQMSAVSSTERIFKILAEQPAVLSPSKRGLDNLKRVREEASEPTQRGSDHGVLRNQEPTPLMGEARGKKKLHFIDGPVTTQDDREVSSFDSSLPSVRY